MLKRIAASLLTFGLVFSSPFALASNFDNLKWKLENKTKTANETLKLDAKLELAADEGPNLAIDEKPVVMDTGTLDDASTGQAQTNSTTGGLTGAQKGGIIGGVLVFFAVMCLCALGCSSKSSSTKGCAFGAAGCIIGRSLGR